MIEGKIAQANGRLKAANIGVTIGVKGSRLYLRATFPPKPGSDRNLPHQQRLFTGYHANPAGLKAAELDARVIGSLLEQNQFSWEPYIKSPQTQAQTVGDWVEKFEKDYFSRRKKTPKSETTWASDYQKVFCTLPAGENLSLELLDQAIRATEPDSRTRKRFVDCCSRLARFAGLEPNFKPLQGSYSSNSVVREVPSDQEIAAWREKIPNPAWRWAYGMMAAYGLRNHEIFHLDCSRLPLLIIKDGGKTEMHRCHPFYPEWFEHWNLGNVQVPPCTGKNNSDLGNRVTVAFARCGLPFSPYDLRHAWAVRTIKFRIPTTLAARMMGHSVDVHERIYQKWITEDFETEVITRLLTGDRPLPPPS